MPAIGTGASEAKVECQPLTTEEFFQQQHDLFLDMMNFCRGVHGEDSGAFRRATYLYEGAHVLLCRYQDLMDHI